jgi:Transposase DDE domain
MYYKNNITQDINNTNFDLVKVKASITDLLDTLGITRTYQKGGRPAKLTIPDIATISLIKSRYGIGCIKQLYLLIQDKYQEEFTLPCYKNFVESLNQFAWILLLIINTILSHNRNISHKVKFIDSTSVSVCTSCHIKEHKVMKAWATSSKTTTGWWYGLKLHTVEDYNGLPLYFQLTTAKTDDRVPLESVFKLFNNSVFVADKGYQSKEKEELAKSYNHILLTGKKKSKHLTTLASWLDIHLLHQRARIETVFSLLKERLGLINTLPRSVKGCLAHYIRTIFGYLVLKGVS